MVPTSTFLTWPQDSGVKACENRGATALSFGPGDRVLAAANDKQIVLWDVVTMEELSRLQGHESHITSLLFSPDHKTL